MYLPLFAVPRDPSEFAPSRASSLQIKRLLLRFDNLHGVGIVVLLQFIKHDISASLQLYLTPRLVNLIIHKWGAVRHLLTTLSDSIFFIVRVSINWVGGGRGHTMLQEFLRTIAFSMQINWERGIRLLLQIEISIIFSLGTLQQLHHLIVSLRKPHLILINDLRLRRDKVLEALEILQSSVTLRSKRSAT